MRSGFVFLVLLAGIFFACGCADQRRPDSSVERTTLPEQPEAFDVAVTSLTCQWAVKTDEYGVKSDCIQIVSKGMVRGPVGARLELPILAWSTDRFDCGAWTHKTGALLAVGHTCVREEGQPETTDWMVDTEGDDCPLKDYFSSDISHSVKLYAGDGLEPEEEDGKNAVCVF